jgi:Integrase zinc binding domain
LKGDLSTPEGMSSKEVKNFVRMCGNFFTDKDGRLYRRSVDSAHKLVVEKGKRMQMLRAAHDALGHRGAYATKQLLVQRFWWPEMERDVNWYVRTCHLCQERQKTLLRIPPTITHTPSLFQVLHADTLHMTPKSNGCGYIVHGRCALSSWMEGRPLRQETGKSIGQWLFEEIICRWGCLMEIVTDNGKPFIAATAWLEQKYGIKGIKISPYNSRANGKIERPHWDVRQMLYKATDGHTNKWFWFFYHVMWADRISVRKGLGCSPYFIATGAHPILPLDLQEATWLVQLPDRILTTEELIGYRARALAKHREHVEEMRIRIDKAKKDAAFRYYMEHVATIKTYAFVPGDLILIRNTEIEQSLNKKMKPRYLGPMVVVSRTRGGAYIVCEMDGSVWQQKVAAFRVIPYFARKSVPLPEGIQKIIDLSPEGLKKLEELPDPADGQEDRDYSFDGVVLGKDGGDELQEDQEYNSEDSDNEEVSGFPARRVLRPRRS